MHNRGTKSLMQSIAELHKPHFYYDADPFSSPSFERELDEMRNRILEGFGASRLRYTFEPEVDETPLPDNVDELIEKDVFSAMDAVLSETRAIVNGTPQVQAEERTRLNELAALGFKNFSNGQQRLSEIKKLDEATQKLHTIERYATEYPLHKFIDEAAVERVCKKYNLALGKASNYIGDIPEKNQREILSFRVACHDVVGVSTEAKSESDSTMRGACDLSIVAPPSKFDASVRLQGHRMVRHEPKDPIVLQPVRFGYLIVTAWGLEAADKDVINPNKN